MSNATNIRQFNGTFPQPTWPSTRVGSLSVNAFGIVTTSLSMAVFANPSLKDQVYKYLLVSSIEDWSYLVLFIAITLSIPICGDSPLLCGSEAQYVQKMYTLWASDYLTSCLALYSILNEIFLSFQRLLILRKNMLMKNWKFWQVGPVMGLISLLVYFPILLVKSVQRTGYIQYQGVVYAVYSTLSTSGAAEVNIVQAFLSGILVTVVIKRLIQQSDNKMHIVTDATYKVNFNGFPLLVVGTTDLARRFHPFGIMLSKRETEADFAFMFRSLHDTARSLGVNCQPNVLVADCAEAITNGFSRVFDLDKRVYCWAHVLRAIDKELNRVHDQELRSKIKKDILDFQSSVLSSNFRKVADLLVAKWNSLNNAAVDTFTAYFTTNWLDRRTGWYDHYSDFVPVTNNAIESTNRYIKETGLGRRRHGIVQFLNLVEAEAGFLRKWSVDRKPENNINVKEFALFPEIGTKEYTSGYNFDRSLSNIKKGTYNGRQLFCASTRPNVQLSSAECASYFSSVNSATVASFGSYIQLFRSISYVAVGDDWRLSVCNCSIWCKYYMCDHVLAVCNRLQHFEFPDVAKIVLVGGNRKRGRPKATQFALDIQPQETNIELVSSSDEEEVVVAAPVVEVPVLVTNKPTRKRARQEEEPSASVSTKRPNLRSASSTSVVSSASVKAIVKKTRSRKNIVA